jgi:oxygen-independent coproporphyrinogen-3 oxidase
MAGIYIHIPFCKRIYSYCDFYKSTLLNLIPDYLKALGMELEIRQPYLQDEVVETVYIGGGTPSLLSPQALSEIFRIIRKFYPLSDDCEITMEANPDDLSREFLAQLYANTPVNRLSIGIQSFIDRDLRLLNRRHNAVQAITSLEDSQAAGYKNISMDLIYGLPGLKDDEWLKNLETAFSLNIQHLSAYHLTFEPGTALSKQISQGKLKPIQEESSITQFSILHTLAARNSFIHYEISNLAKEGFFFQAQWQLLAGKEIPGSRAIGSFL